MFCGESMTLCHNCGKPVHTAQGVCPLCGDTLCAIYVSHFPKTEPKSNTKPAGDARTPRFAVASRYALTLKVDKSNRVSYQQLAA